MKLFILVDSVAQWIERLPPEQKVASSSLAGIIPRNVSKDVTKEEFDNLVNKLGNKILLEENINKSISNDWFKTKKGTTVKSKQGYLGSEFGLAKALANYPKDKWKKSDIKQFTEVAAHRIADFVFHK